MVHDKLNEYFGWRKALGIATVIVLLNIAFLVTYTMWQVHVCVPLAQVFDASFSPFMVQRRSLKRAVTSRRLCSTEMISIRSQYYSANDLAALQEENLPVDTVCHLNGGRNKHVQFQYNSTAREGHPSITVHDISWVEWYPCMFPGMSCDDYAPEGMCNGLASDTIIRGCQAGYVHNSTTRWPVMFHNSNASESYTCNHQSVPMDNDLAQKFVHFDSCQGLVQASFVQCPRLGNVLGAAKGLVGLWTAGLLVVLLPLGFWLYEYGSGKERTVVNAEGILPEAVGLAISPFS